MLGVQQQSATQPSDLLILYGNRQAADRVVALAFELARANAELLSSEAEIQQDAAADPGKLAAGAATQSARSGCAPGTSIQSEIAATQRQLAGCGRRGAHCAASEARRAAERARSHERAAESPENNMLELAHETDANGSGVTALKEHINAIAASIPAAISGGDA